MRLTRRNQRRSSDVEGRTERAFARADVLLFGLPPAWPGTRRLGAWTEDLQTLGLVHLDPAAGSAVDASWIVVVESSDDRRYMLSDGLNHHLLAYQLAHLEIIGGDYPSPRRSGTRLHPSMPADDAPWTTMELPVDGVPHRFDMLEGEGEWCACGRVASTFVAVYARGVPSGDVSLESDPDLAAYVAGTREARRRAGLGSAG